MKLNIGALLKAAIKLASPVIVTIAATKAQGAIEKQADKLIKKAEK